MVNRHPKQLYVLPCGSGKSRVASTIALLLLGCTSWVKKVHLVFVNDILKKKDQEDFKDMVTIMSGGNRVEYHSNMNFPVAAN